MHSHNVSMYIVGALSRYVGWLNSSTSNGILILCQSINYERNWKAVIFTHLIGNVYTLIYM